MQNSGKNLLLAMTIGMSAQTLAARTPDAEAILSKAERIRNPDEDYSVTVKLTGVSEGKGEKKVVEKEFETLIKGRDKALVKYVKPSVDNGKQILMVEDAMWIYMPSSAKPIRVSPQQKVSGNAAYGDITRLDFTGNYDVKYLRSATLRGKKAHVLELTARPGRPVTYPKIEYWVADGSFRPLKTLFKTKQGKTLKVGYYENYADVFGVQRPTRFRMVDKLSKKNTTTLDFQGAEKRSLPALMFRKQNLGRG